LTKNIVVKPSIRPDIQYLALNGYPAGYSVSGFWISRISGASLPVLVCDFRMLPQIRERNVFDLEFFNLEGLSLRHQILLKACRVSGYR
jgi:hypothetical protein